MLRTQNFWNLTSQAFIEDIDFSYKKNRDKYGSLVTINNMIRNRCRKYNGTYMQYYNHIAQYWIFEIKLPQNNEFNIYVNLDLQQIEIFYHCFKLMIKLTNSHLHKIIDQYFRDGEIWNMPWDACEEDY